ncbi:hypothetical protein D3C85_683470 [compost metagenome]
MTTANGMPRAAHWRNASSTSEALIMIRATSISASGKALIDGQQGRPPISW